jgi:hypothetical protein
MDGLKNVVMPGLNYMNSRRGEKYRKENI